MRVTLAFGLALVAGGAGAQQSVPDRHPGASQPAQPPVSDASPGRAQTAPSSRESGSEFDGDRYDPLTSYAVEQLDERSAYRSDTSGQQGLDRLDGLLGGALIGGRGPAVATGYAIDPAGENRRYAPSLPPPPYGYVQNFPPPPPTPYAQ